jgi:transposase
MTLSQHTNLQTILIVIYTFVDDMQKAMLTSIRPLLSHPDHFAPPLKKHNLSIAELATLAIFRFFTGHRNWKDFYRHITTYHAKDFPTLPTYQNFIASVNSLSGFASILLHGFMHFFREHTPELAHKYADSTKLIVCEITRSLRHRVAKGYASKSKTHTGWFYGFRLHIVVNEWMEVLGLKITTATEDERRALATMWDGIIGMIIADAGYLGKDWVAKAAEAGKTLSTAVRTNMKKLMTKAQHQLLKERQKVEIVFSTLKLRFGLVNTLPRSVLGYFAHYLWALTAYELKHFMEGRGNGLPEPEKGVVA